MKIWKSELMKRLNSEKKLFYKWKKIQKPLSRNCMNLRILKKILKILKKKLIINNEYF